MLRLKDILKTPNDIELLEFLLKRNNANLTEYEYCVYNTSNFELFSILVSQEKLSKYYYNCDEPNLVKRFLDNIKIDWTKKNYKIIRYMMNYTNLDTTNKSKMMNFGIRLLENKSFELFDKFAETIDINDSRFISNIPHTLDIIKFLVKYGVKLPPDFAILNNLTLDVLEFIVEKNLIQY